MTTLNTKSIAELEQLELTEPSPTASPLAKRLYQLMNRPLTGLSIADWRALIIQDIGLDFLMVPALELIEKDPLLETEHFRGDLLASLLGVNAGFFLAHPDLASRLEAVISHLPAALDRLDSINFDTSSEALEEAIEAFRHPKR